MCHQNKQRWRGRQTNTGFQRGRGRAGAPGWGWRGGGADVRERGGQRPVSLFPPGTGVCRVPIPIPQGMGAQGQVGGSRGGWVPTGATGSLLPGAAGCSPAPACALPARTALPLPFNGS